jgi:hypothetical protein
LPVNKVEKYKGATPLKQKKENQLGKKSFLLLIIGGTK